MDVDVDIDVDNTSNFARRQGLVDVPKVLRYVRDIAKLLENDRQ